MNIPKKAWCNEILSACIKGDKTLCDIYFTDCVHPW